MLGAFQELMILKKEKKMKKQLLALLILGAFVGQVYGAQDKDYIQSTFDDEYYKVQRAEEALLAIVVEEEARCARLFERGRLMGMGIEEALEYVKRQNKLRTIMPPVIIEEVNPQVCPHGPNVACGCMVPKQQEEVVLEDCPICMFSLLPEEDLSVTPCGHTYHSECLKMSSKVKKECPLCRGKL